MTTTENPLGGAVPLAEAARRWLPLSRTGLPKKPSVLWRWSEYGILVSGRRVKLAVTRVGGQRYVTQADLQRFLDDLNAAPPDDLAAESPDPAPAPVKPSRAKAAREALAGMGIK